MRAAAFLLVLLAATVHAADAPDPLPEGAKLRLGTTRMRNVGHGITPDGKHLLTSRNFKTVLIDVTTGADAGELPDSAMTWSADGKRAATANGIVRVWDRGAKPKILATKRQFSNTAISPVSLSADGKLLAVGAEGSAGNPKAQTALVWDVAADKQLTEVAVEQNGAVGVRLSPDGKTLATFGSHNDPMRKFGEKNPGGWPEQAVQLWDAASGKALGRAAVTAPQVTGVAFSPDGGLLALSGWNGLVSLRDARTGKEQRQLFGRSYVGMHLAFSPDGKTLAAAGADGRSQRWTVADGKMLDWTDPPLGPQEALSFRLKELVFTDPDRAVAWGAMGSVAVVWEIPSGKRLSPAGGHYKPVMHIGFTADGKHVVTAGFDSGLLRWDAATGELIGPAVLRPPWNGNALPSVQLLPGGNRGVSDRTGASVYDLVTGRELFRLPVAENSRNTGFLLRASHDGTKAVTRLMGTDKDKTDRYEVWDLVAPKRLGEAAVPKAEWGTADVSADGMRLVTFTRIGPDAEVTGWEVATGKKLGSVGVAGANTMVAVPGAEPLALVPTKDGKFAVIDYAAGKVTATLDAGRTDTTGVPVFAPDGKSFAAAFWKYELNEAVQRAEVRVYAWPGGEVRHTFRGHTAMIYSLAFSADGKTLASGSEDTTVLLWDVSK